MSFIHILDLFQYSSGSALNSALLSHFCLWMRKETILKALCAGHIIYVLSLHCIQDCFIQEPLKQTLQSHSFLLQGPTPESSFYKWAWNTWLLNTTLFQSNPAFFNWNECFLSSILNVALFLAFAVQFHCHTESLQHNDGISWHSLFQVYTLVVLTLLFAFKPAACLFPNVHQGIFKTVHVFVYEVNVFPETSFMALYCKCFSVCV